MAIAHILRLAVPVALLLSLSACSDSDPLSYAADVEPILTSNCSPCHVDSDMPSGALNLSAGAGFASLVGVASVIETPKMRVVAGDSDSSYIIHKLEGTQTNAAQMPFERDPLSGDDIQTIRDWIDEGAAE